MVTRRGFFYSLMALCAVLAIGAFLTGCHRSGGGQASGPGTTGSTVAETQAPGEGPAEVLKAMVETYNSGDSEGAKKYLTDHGATVSKQIGMSSYEGVLGVWGRFRIGTTTARFEKDAQGNNVRQIDLKTEYVPGYDHVSVTGSTARIPLMDVTDGVATRFKFSDAGGLNFVLVLRDGKWLVDDVEFEGR